MRWAAIALLSVGLGLFAPSVAHAQTGERTHVVAKGQTLGHIAKRYHVTIKELCAANHIRRRDKIRPGEKLVIPDPGDAHPAARVKESDADQHDSDADQHDDGGDAAAPEHHSTHLAGGLRELDVPGAPPAYYYPPVGRGHLGLRPVIMYLHGRGGHPDQDCRRWAHVARRLGWVVCPSGPEDRGDGARGWNNNWAEGQNIVMATLHALRKKYGRRVQLYGNTLIGFSEGAFVAMNVGVREPHTFNRWLILAADNDYWGAAGLEALQKDHARLRRVYLITGEQDGTYDGTKRVKAWLKHAGVPTIVRTPKDMGHEVALGKEPSMYRRALGWLDHGAPSPRPRHKPTAHRDEPDHGRKR
jgi:predicted esterase